MEKIFLLFILFIISFENNSIFADQIHSTAEKQNDIVVSTQYRKYRIKRNLDLHRKW